jgi:hypothetical protein
MYRTQYRLLTILATGAVAFTAGATPALAGSDGCDDEDGCQAPAQVVPAPPAPVTLQAPQAPKGGDTRPERSSRAPATAKKPRVKAVRVANRTVAQRTAPRGAVAAGAGGTAPHGPDGALFGLAGGLVLLAAGGRLVAAGRS